MLFNHTHHARRTPGGQGPRGPGWLGRAAICVGLAAALALPATGGSRALAQGPSGAAGYRLIVNPGNPTAEVERAFVAQAFLRKISRWPTGETILPIDLDQNSRVRRRWSSEVLNRSVEAVKSYWQGMIFSGRSLPPPEAASDDQVVDYVLHRPGSIGYVSAEANLHGARVVMLRQ
jgi:ABC-type phosphate transport system substrate-binding protein